MTRRHATDSARKDADARGLVRHGTLNAYQYWGCHCDTCRAENTRYHRELRARERKQATGEDVTP